MNSDLPFPNFGKIDYDLLALFGVKSELLRRGLVTLARLGVAWRRAEPERARNWLSAVETHPFFKGGQTLFDLLEFEDFMLDTVDAADFAAASALMDKVAEAVGHGPVIIPLIADLPPLEAGFYLYRDVVLGILWLLLSGENTAKTSA